MGAAQAIINRCVALGAMGGETRMSDGFMVMVVNELTFTPNLRDAWSACLRVGLRADITPCAGRPGDGVRRYTIGP